MLYGTVKEVGLTLLYGTVAWDSGRGQVNVIEMKCLRCMVGMTHINRLRIQEVCIMAKI